MESTVIFSATTKGIKITAVPLFLPQQSIIQDNMFFWSYTIFIENENDIAVQLLKRHWKIIDANGDMTEVSGEGVIGQQPIVGKAQVYQYTSGTYLKTTSGMMMGKYMMKNVIDGSEFEVDVPTFSLDSPLDKHQVL